MIRNDRILQAIQEGFIRGGNVYDIYDSLMAHGYHIVSTPKWSFDEHPVGLNMHPGLESMTLNMDCNNVVLSSRKLFESQYFGVQELDRFTERMVSEFGFELVKKLLDYET